jgi:protein TonB
MMAPTLMASTLATRARRGVLRSAIAVAAATAATVTAPASARAQSVVGRVREDGTRRLLGGVAVALLDSAGFAVAQATTDSGGAFYLDAPAPGRYARAFTWAGTTRVTPPRELAKGQESQAEYDLVPPPPHVAVDTAVVPTHPASETPSGERPYFEFQVKKPVRPLPGNAPPRYPENAKRLGVTAALLTQFVVDTAGRPVMATLRFLKSGGPEFDEEVRAALPRMRFAPAQLADGRKVPQIVQQPFTFSLAPDLGPTPCVPSGARMRDRCRP